MKTIFLNLPYQKKIIRRFISSYYAPNFLFPPYELLSMATLVKKWKNGTLLFIDAIAEGKNAKEVLEDITRFSPDIIVTYLGHFSINNDLKTVGHIKSIFPKIKIIGTGFFASILPEEILKNSSLDIIIKDEPELTFSCLYDNIKNNGSLQAIKGIAYKDANNIINTPPAGRIENLDELPFPDLSILGNNLNIYNEPYLGKPFTTITASRGCVNKCSFCIHTYGDKIFNRSIKNITEEIDHNLANYGIINIRFLDDTFTLNKDRALEICGILKDRKISWTCLSRVDTLDEKLIYAMKTSGCKRLYLGIESGSQKILNILNKGIDKSFLEEKLKQIKNSGLEVNGFFITGVPEETDADIDESIRLARETGIDYIVVKILKIWPGTELYKKYGHLIYFNLFPFQNKFKDNIEEQNAIAREKRFYREFYLRPGYILKQVKNLFLHPKEILSGFISLLKFLFCENDIKKDESYEKDFI